MARSVVGMAGVAALGGLLALPAVAGRLEPQDGVEQQGQGGREEPAHEPENPEQDQETEQGEVDHPRLPPLSVGVRDALHWMGPGDESQYVITVRNDGGERFERILLFQSLMPEMEVIDAGEQATTWDSAIAWEASLDPGEEIERTTRVRLGDLEQGTRYVGTTACVQLEQGGPLVACGTDANLVPPEERQDQSGQPERPEQSNAQGQLDHWLVAAVREYWPPWSSLVGAGLGAVIGLGVVLVLWRRRIRKSARHV
ncbi:hypothetical protein CDO52_11250 [Nocardiopsis gilva YIM 90087]|uniref:DUF11 domain-containing protein n=1 Tax=Nocardiopsis gilva YIM 90087 TaxID=1235441 RepID=A0A223S555_9ACTN|nr:hypothetical protein [Nocardiopsis gilva]ASU83276.1 hypothetical protein CDO52_11250 [Nocardiopsis gilva YIM 90087]